MSQPAHLPLPTLTHRLRRRRGDRQRHRVRPAGVRLFSGIALLGWSRAAQLFWHGVRGCRHSLAVPTVSQPQLEHALCLSAACLHRRTSLCLAAPSARATQPRSAASWTAPWRWVCAAAGQQMFGKGHCGTCATGHGAAFISSAGPAPVPCNTRHACLPPRPLPARRALRWWA